MTTKRTTKETKVTATLERGAANRTISTGDGFFDHMLDTLAKYADWGLKVEVDSQDGIAHHAIEDAAIVVGREVRRLMEAAPVARFGSASVVMDDALVAATLDAGGRAYYEGELPIPMMEHALRSLAFEAGLTLHIEVRRGREEHHVTEAAFKAVGMCLAQALAPAKSTRSTKGAVSYGG